MCTHDYTNTSTSLAFIPTQGDGRKEGRKEEEGGRNGGRS